MVTRITSKDNSIVKKLKQLEAKKYRDRFSQFVLEGVSVISEALDEKIHLGFAVYSDSFMKTDISRQIVDHLLKNSIPVYSMEDRLFASISGTETPQGIIAAADKPKWDLAFADNRGNNFVVLDRVSDPGNVGTIIRTAEAAGFSGVFVLKGSADPYSAKVSRAAAGALMRLPIYMLDEPDELINIMHKYDKKLLCTDPRSSKYYYDIDIAEDTAIIIGNEAAGACQELMECSDLRVGIPMEGKTESLNAAIAACVIMYESFRQKNIKNIVLQK